MLYLLSLILLPAPAYPLDWAHTIVTLKGTLSLHALSVELDLVTHPQPTHWTGHTPLLPLKEHSFSMHYLISWILLPAFSLPSGLSIHHCYP
jgi:hypothetical protein